MTFQPCRPATIKLLPYERAPFDERSCLFCDMELVCCNTLAVR